MLAINTGPSCICDPLDDLLLLFEVLHFDSQFFIFFLDPWQVPLLQLFLKLHCANPRFYIFSQNLTRVNLRPDFQETELAQLGNKAII